MMLAVGSFVFTGVLFLYRSVKVIVLIVIIFLSNVAIIKTSPVITPFHFFGYSNFSNIV